MKMKFLYLVSKKLLTKLYNKISKEIYKAAEESAYEMGQKTSSLLELSPFNNTRLEHAFHLGKVSRFNKKYIFFPKK